MPKISGIRKRSSVDFVRSVFAAYQRKDLLVLLNDHDELPAIKGFQPGDIRTPEGGGGWFEGNLFQSDSDEPAQIVFTSGTEGKPKTVVLSHRALSDVVTRLNHAMKVDASIREYVGVPVTFSFGLGRCRAVTAAGGQLYLPERGFDPLEIRSMLEAEEINAISAVPTLFRILLQDPTVLGGMGSRVKWIEMGSQYMSRSEKEQMKELFPNAVILQHYGLTEASRSTFLLIDQTEGRALESVGRPSGDVQVQISEAGRIRIRGPHVALGRLVNGEILSMQDTDGWLTTGDNGHLEGENVYFDGRADDIINSGGIKVDPGHLEQEVRQILKVKSGFAIARIKDPTRGDGFFVGVEKGRGLDLRAVHDAVHSALGAREINAGTSVKVQEVDEIPITGTGKVQRNALAKLYNEEIQPSLKTHTRGAGVLALYQHMFDRADIPTNATFQSLGGDSLNYVQMSIGLEKELGALPPNWDNLPIAELEKHTDGSKKRLSALETNILLRAFAITCVVATHAGWHEVRGGTFLLFFLIGFNLARFKSPAFLKGDIWGPLFSYTKVLLIPYFVLAVPFMLYNKAFYPDLLLLYTNLVEWRFSQLFPFWFVQVLVQCLVLTGLLFSIPMVRKWASVKPWTFASTLTMLLIAIWIVAPYVWNTEHIRNLVPQRYMALLWLGWCCQLANTRPRRAAALILGLVFAYMDTGFDQRAGWVVLGTVSVLYLPTIRVPGILRTGVQIVASATFHIFILNGIIAYALGKVLRLNSNLAVFLLAFLGSIAGSWAIEQAGEMFSRIRLRFGLRTV